MPREVEEVHIEALSILYLRCHCGRAFFIASMTFCLSILYLRCNEDL